jgi:hypothetical protein
VGTGSDVELGIRAKVAQFSLLVVVNLERATETRRPADARGRPASARANAEGAVATTSTAGATSDAVADVAIGDSAPRVVTDAFAAVACDADVRGSADDVGGIGLAVPSPAA